MVLSIVIVFIIGYIFIAFEHFVKVDKAASALIMGVVCWALFAILTPTTNSEVEGKLLHSMSEIAGILFFLLGAMTIVELIDSHEGFDIITNSITTTSKQKLLWIIGGITFFLSAILDNLTTAIVMMSMCSKLLQSQKDRWRFGGLIIINANAGGAFSPLGDVTTTMLWVGKQITASNIIVKLLVPSLVCALVPMLIFHFLYKNQKLIPKQKTSKSITTLPDRKLIFYSGVVLLLLVPVFKMVTHLPPFMGILLALGIMWVITTFVHHHKQIELQKKLSVVSALQRIDAPSILFFLGILLAVSALQATGVLQQTATYLTTHLHSTTNIATALGALSAVIDNVPLVAATQGMYSLQEYPTNHQFWELIALTTGTGGSMIIIGSAAGVAVMGIQNIPFGWYIKNISWIAAIGFILGIATFLCLQ